MVEEPPWIAGSVLRRTHAVLARRPVFKSLLAVVVRGLDARSPTDAALVALCPGARMAAAAYYAGEGPQLGEALGSEDLRLLDGTPVAVARSGEGGVGFVDRRRPRNARHRAGGATGTGRSRRLGRAPNRPSVSDPAVVSPHAVGTTKGSRLG
jgi:hypothetical protein